jgi:predicted transcriptional regulator
MKSLSIRTIKTPSHPQTKEMFWQLFGKFRGTETRIKIMHVLRDIPRNTNQLSLDVKVDYKCIQHHLKKLEQNNVVTKIGNGYSTMYYVSSLFESNQELFNEIITKLYSKIEIHESPSSL